MTINTRMVCSILLKLVGVLALSKAPNWKGEAILQGLPCSIKVARGCGLALTKGYKLPENTMQQRKGSVRG